mmetsp:Transcript_18349/g.36056  ORF Transcript_18349/g.36056 Transcript_18349/m.36056 type:complete len:434 (-) Transcript_18349:160-1461(-)|eukprot:CAMPEP_0171499806 /NCGR_PEP_ID=MMETSP0958-20121227/8632_1 /TAXON_ID=87120 /ORGANISM="Aurantiochytrium limacinum, Strain ATCCMYA-1381" /LENGTH=433 /DNA_ID=CAMNT_0012034401 /DNA_START=1498 /DNA_END=2799 /DNA_ORIENTATION=+
MLGYIAEALAPHVRAAATDWIIENYIKPQEQNPQDNSTTSYNPNCAQPQPKEQQRRAPPPPPHGRQNHHNHHNHQHRRHQEYTVAIPTAATFDEPEFPNDSDDDYLSQSSLSTPFGSDSSASSSLSGEHIQGNRDVEGYSRESHPHHSRRPQKKRSRREAVHSSSDLGRTLQWLQGVYREGLDTFFTTGDQLQTVDLRQPSREERWSVAKQKFMHTCSIEPEHIRERYDDLPGLRKRIMREGEILHSFVKRANETIRSVDIYLDGHDSSRALDVDLEALRRYVQTCEQISFFERAVRVIDSLDRDRKALRHMRLVLDRKFRKSRKLHADYEAARRGQLDRSKLSEKKRMQLFELHTINEQYEKAENSIYEALGLLISKLSSVHVSLINSAQVEFGFFQALKNHLFLHPTVKGDKLYKARYREFYLATAKMYPQ